MKVVIGLWAWNVYKFKRLPLLERTLASIERAGHPYELIPLTNGSTDATDKYIRNLGGIVDNGHSQIWYAMQRLVEAALEREPDLIILSADDIEYVDGWLARLVSFVEAAPDDVKLTSLFLEPLWNWNEVRAAIDAGGERALIRDSVPGASWVFRAADWPLIGPIPQKMPGEDLEICQKLRAQDYRLAQLDLGMHIGERQSSWGNRSYEYAQPLDREKWGI